MPRNALQNNPVGLLGQTEMRPTPRNALLGAIADALQAGKGFANKAQIPSGVPLLGGQGLGDVLLGQAPQELSEWSYGNAPMRINPNAGKTASYVPEMKRGRGQGVADALMLAQVPGGKNALLAGAGALDNSAFNKSATVWHGSPHKFDRFDSSKIGTGEGAQAYGHGLYLAESPDVARGYQAKLAGGAVVDGRGVPVDPTRTTADLEKALRASGLSWDDAEHAATGWSSAVFNGNTSGLHPVVQKELAARGLASKMDGSLYKVDLPDEKIARMLDWDAPLGQQPAIVRESFPSSIKEATLLDRQRRALMKQAEELGDASPEEVKALRSAARELRARQVAVGKNEMTGQDLYGALMDILGDKGGNLSVVGMPSAPQLNGPAAAQLLRKLGVPGSRHLDGNSRSAGSGTSNFVVFPGEENALTILERNGLLPPR